MVATKFFLKPHAFPLFPISSPPYFSILPKNSIISLFSSTPQQQQQQQQKPSINPTTLSTTNTLSYGPSLHKGKLPFSSKPHQREHKFNDEFELDEENFARVFDVSALRVPARHCFVLESRLRGHLLNWPRIRNIARVPGDEVEDEVGALLSQEGSGAGDDEETRIDRVKRRIYGTAGGDGEEEFSDVLYREKLAKDFNSRGFVKFRNLAKISRPKRKRKEGKGEEKEGSVGKGKGEIAAVEVVEEEGEGEDWRGLLGEDFKGKEKWRGSTRLLLLDERYAEKGMEELPQAIKVALQETAEDNTRSSFELIRCKLTLFYDYWQMNEILEALLPKDTVIPSAFETVGHIAHLNLQEEHLPYKKLIAKVVLDKNLPKIQTVVNKVDAIQNDYRTMQLEILAGNHSLATTVVENGLKFHVDLATVYWNSRLATERQRLLSGFSRNDVVCDVFSGVGPIAISAAKIVKRVYANDLNPCAVDFLERNTIVNKLERKIEIFNMDGRRFIAAMFASKKAESITQVVMNLPNNGVEFLDAFRGVFRSKSNKSNDTLPMIHLYGFSKAEDPEFDFHERIRIMLKEVAVDIAMRRVRAVAPGKWMLCASFRLPMSVATANQMPFSYLTRIANKKRLKSIDKPSILSKLSDENIDEFDVCGCIRR